MSIIILVGIVFISVLFAGAILLLVYYSIKKKITVATETINTERFFQTKSEMKKISINTDCILSEVKNLSQSMSSITNNLNDSLFEIEAYFDKIGYVNRKEDKIDENIKRITFRIQLENGSIILMGIAKDSLLNTIHFSSHMFFLKNDNASIYKELLLINGNTIPRIAVRELQTDYKAVTVEQILFSVKNQCAIYDWIMGNLVNTNEGLLEYAKNKKWEIELIK